MLLSKDKWICILGIGTVKRKSKCERVNMHYLNSSFTSSANDVLEHFDSCI